MSILYFTQSQIEGTSRAMYYRELQNFNQSDVARHGPTNVWFSIMNYILGKIRDNH